MERPYWDRPMGRPWDIPWEDVRYWNRPTGDPWDTRAWDDEPPMGRPWEGPHMGRPRDDPNNVLYLD